MEGGDGRVTLRGHNTDGRVTVLHELPVASPRSGGVQECLDAPSSGQAVSHSPGPRAEIARFASQLLPAAPDHFPVITDSPGNLQFGPPTLESTLGATAGLFGFAGPVPRQSRRHCHSDPIRLEIAEFGVRECSRRGLFSDVLIRKYAPAITPTSLR